MKKQVYRIKHNYQIGNQDVFVASESDPTDAAIYCQFVAETTPIETPGDIVSNLGIAAALVHFYGCKHSAASKDAITIDMHWDREIRCGDWWFRHQHNSSLARDGLVEYLKPHMDP